jgi:hypothetical protein
MNPKLKEFLDKCTILPHDEYLKELENGGILVCGKSKEAVQHFPDNKIGRCGICNEEIYFRPYNTVAINKICIECMVLMAEDMRKEPN